MVSLQPKLNLRVSQKQILTPGLVQMVSVLALNKIELKDMINAEMMENPVLDEVESQVPLLDEVAGREIARDQATTVQAEPEATPRTKDDPFEQIDFGSFFQDYLDPGYRSPDSESVERPSFENFLSKPTSLTDHLMWQLGSTPVSPTVRRAAELVIGNLNEDGYLTASDKELLAAAAGERAAEPLEPAMQENGGKRTRRNKRSAETQSPNGSFAGEADADFSVDTANHSVVSAADVPLASEPVMASTSVRGPGSTLAFRQPAAAAHSGYGVAVATEPDDEIVAATLTVSESAPPPIRKLLHMPGRAPVTLEDLHEAIELVQQMDPVGVGARDLRECLLAQIRHLEEITPVKGSGGTAGHAQLLSDATKVASGHLHELQNKQYKEIARAISRPLEAVMKAYDLIRTLDPRPGLRYNIIEPRLIEPDVAFIKQGDDYLVLLNDEDVPQLRLNPTYKRMLNRDTNDKEVRGYVKERYKSAIQLIKNIEQRKQTILKVCYAILGRQRDFLDAGIDQLKPMMIKDVAEEIGVHPSTVSRAVSNKYAHTSQGVFELRYFFSESVNGPEGGNTSLLILKRRVKKLIEEEDATKPLTDDQITRILQSQGIQVTRRTVAKYREDLGIPSTHQRRVKK